MPDNDNETMRQVAISSTQARNIASERQFITVPAGTEVRDLEALLPAPTRIRNTPVFSEPESFHRYFNQFKDATSRIHASEARESVFGIIDASHKDMPQWESHTPQLKLTPTPEWTTWLQFNRKAMGQQEFAEFIEERAGEISSPSSEDLQQVALTLKVRNNVTFDSKIKLENGSASFTYSEDIKGVTERNDLEIPTKFVIQLAAFKGTAPFNLECLLRWRFKDGSVTFHYVIQKWEKAKEQAFKDVLATIFDATEVSPLVIV